MNITKIIALGALLICTSSAMQQQDNIHQLMLVWQGKIGSKRIELLHKKFGVFSFRKFTKGQKFLALWIENQKEGIIVFDTKSFNRLDSFDEEDFKILFDPTRFVMKKNGKVVLVDKEKSVTGVWDKDHYYHDIGLPYTYVQASNNGLIGTICFNTDTQNTDPVCWIEIWSADPFRRIIKLPKEWKTKCSNIFLKIDPQGKFLVALVSESIEEGLILYVFRPDESDTISKMIKARDCFFKFK